MSYSEADTKSKLIEPNLKKSSWDESNFEREYQITGNTKVVVGEEFHEKKTSKYADYVLKINGNIIAVVEAKSETEDLDNHTKQIKMYVDMMGLRFGFLTNGIAIYKYDSQTQNIETIQTFPTPDELIAMIYGKNIDIKADPLTFPLYNLGNRTPRYYQLRAVSSIISNIKKGNKKTLLVMATGTGKTFVSFQTIWKLFKSGFFNKILFLADRNILVDQAFDDFEPFKDARFRIENGQFNPNRNIYFSTYQTLYSQSGDKYFYENIDKDFFDLIIIDECHRSRYGSWGEVLDFFSSAYTVGLTATPERSDNVDVFDYFGQPVFQYSMGKAIEDGYLVPYKIYKITLNIHKTGIEITDKIKILNPDEVDVEEVKKQRFFDPSSIERKIIGKEITEKMCQKMLDIINANYKPGAKTIVFAVDKAHAGRISDTLCKLTNDKDFATRIVSEDKDDLRRFKDIEQNKPVVATTVDLLSTGVDITTVENVVFARNIGSTTLFKQIIGRGSRLSKGKGFFRIIDFTNATRFLDEWDVPGEGGDGPEEEAILPPLENKFFGQVVDKESGEGIYKAYIKAKIGKNILSHMYSKQDGSFEFYGLPSNEKIRIIIEKKGYKTKNNLVENKNSYEIQTFEIDKIKKLKKIKVEGLEVYEEEEIIIEFDGKRMNFGEYKIYSKDKLKEMVFDMDDLKGIWTNIGKREEFLEKLKEKNIYLDFIKNTDGLSDIDKFDLIAHSVFGAPLISRHDRYEKFMLENSKSIKNSGEDFAQVVFWMLEKYKNYGEEELSGDVFINNPTKLQTIKQVYTKEKGGLRKFMSGLLNKIYFNKELEYGRK